MSWLEEAADRAAANYLPLCQVCHTPVRPEDEPVEVELDEAGRALIHGAWDCMDEPRCEERIRTDGSSGEASARCVLPASHAAATECLEGEWA